MNINKKLNRFQQWGKEKMGAEVHTNTSENFKALEGEMNLRHTGMEKLHGAMNAYVKSLNKRTEGEGREKNTPVGYLGATMTKHGEDFEDGSKFGECLINFGQANERNARTQDAFANQASATWLAAMDRSLAQMKDYQNARKKLDSRRLAYDTSLAKMQRAKKEDFRAEEELRSQKAKFEESTEDVHRRMDDIVEAENDNVVDLYAFLEAEIEYHDRCRETLMRLKESWPMESAEESPPTKPPRHNTSRSRNTTPSRATVAADPYEEELEPPVPSFRTHPSRTASGTSTPHRETSNTDLFGTAKAQITRAATNPEQPPQERGTISRTVTETALSRAALNPVKRTQAANGYGSHDGGNAFDDNASDRDSSPARSYATGTNTTGSGAISRNTSWGNLTSDGRQAANTGKKAPPPPPPSRATKPKPPPPPMKRSALSSGNVLQT